MASKLNRRVRPPLSKESKVKIARLHREGVGPNAISEELGVSLPTVYRWRNYRPEEKVKKRRRRSSLSKEKESEVLEAALEYQKRHEGELNMTAVSNTLGISYGIVCRILKKHKIVSSPGEAKATAKGVATPIPTQRTISRLSGYSQATVSRALKHDLSVGDTVRREVEEVAKKIGYRVNPQLSSLSQTRWRRQKFNLKLAYLAYQHKYVPIQAEQERLVDALKVEAEKRGCLLEYINYLDYSNVKRMVQVLHHRGVQGIILGHGFRQEGMDLLFKEKASLWSNFSLLRIGFTALEMTGITAALNRIASQQVESTMFSGFSLAKERGYRRIAYINLSQPDQPMLNTSWVSIKVLGLIKELQASSLAPHNRIPSLLLENLGAEYEHKMIRDYITEYAPDIILSNDNRGYDIIKKIKSRQKPAYFSLNRGTDKKGAVAGIVLPDCNDYAHKMIQVLSEQIYHNQFGLPDAPQVHNMPYKQWVAGKSFPLKKAASKKLEWVLPEAGIGEGAHNNRAEFLDVGNVANCCRTTSGQWFGAATMPLPNQELNQGALHFRPITEAKKNVLIMRSALHLNTADEKRYPEQVIFRVNRKLQTCSFLHTAGFVIGLQTFASYIFHYADGTQQTLPLTGLSPESSNAYHTTESNNHSIYSEPLTSRYSPQANIGDWHPCYDIGKDQLASIVQPIIVSNAASSFYCYLFALQWTNPTPDKEIISLEIRSSSEARSTLAVLAITLGLS